MPKTIAITPSWYWPTGAARVTGVPPFRLDEQLVDRWARHHPEATALIDAENRLSGGQLAEMVRSVASGMRSRIPSGERMLLVSGPSVEGVVLLLAASAAGIPTVLASTSQVASVAPRSGTTVCCGDALGASTAASAGLQAIRMSELAGSPEPILVGTNGVLSAPAIAAPTENNLAWHSHKSLLGGAISLGTFFGVDDQRPWMSTIDVSSWQGIYGVAVPLAAGASVVLSPPGEAALDAIGREGVGSSVWHLEQAFHSTKDAKRQVKSIRGVQERIVLVTGKLFDPDQRRRVGKMFESPALTMFGLPETGPIFASHPSWYLDESIGLPISNVWVVPVDPRSGNPVPTLWELVESAMVTVWSPSLFKRYEDDSQAERFRDGRFVTGIIASSDANGMIYMLPD